MKISESRASAQTGSSRTTQARSSGSGFAPAGAPAARGTAGLSGPASLAAVDALLALQETDDALHAPRRRAIRRGEEMLDILDEIKLSLLAGQLPKSRLTRLHQSGEWRHRSSQSACAGGHGYEVRGSVLFPRKHDPQYPKV